MGLGVSAVLHRAAVVALALSVSGCSSSRLSHSEPARRAAGSRSVVPPALARQVREADFKTADSSILPAGFDTSPVSADDPSSRPRVSSRSQAPLGNASPRSSASLARKQTFPADAFPTGASDREKSTEEGKPRLAEALESSVLDQRKPFRLHLDFDQSGAVETSLPLGEHKPDAAADPVSIARGEKVLRLFGDELLIVEHKIPEAGDPAGDDVQRVEATGGTDAADRERGSTTPLTTHHSPLTKGTDAAGRERVSTAVPLQDVVTIDLASALNGAAGRNPRVGAAVARIQEALAGLQRAEVLWLPSIRAGASHNKHEGTLQESGGRVLDVSRAAIFSGLGARAVGAASPAVPGLLAEFHLSDAIFQPQIADRAAAARRSAASATTQDVLLSAALAYLDLLRAFQGQAIAEETLENTRQLADLTRSFAETGQGTQADADRAQAELAVRQNDLAQAIEATEVASARLARILSQDPTVRLIPSEPTIVPIELVPVEFPVQALVATGLANRPELAEAQFLVAEALERLNREKYAPLVPSVLLGVSYGGFGGGVGDTIANYHDRFDFDVAAWWEVRNLGFGEKAARASARARIDQARFQQVRVMDQVASEIAEAHAQVQARQRQIATAQAGIRAARDSYRRNFQRIRDVLGLPIEALQAIQALDLARREYLRAVADYDEAQFRLYRALGWCVP